jgi:hypothetical protein
LFKSPEGIKKERDLLYWLLAILCFIGTVYFGTKAYEGTWGKEIKKSGDAIIRNKGGGIETENYTVQTGDAKNENSGSVIIENSGPEKMIFKGGGAKTGNVSGTGNSGDIVLSTKGSGDIIIKTEDR